MNNDSRRPSIIVSVENGTAIPQNAAPLFNGIKKEQIPVMAGGIDIDSVVSRAYQSALALQLSVGIAFGGDRLIVHYKNLKGNKPLFDKTINDGEQLRVLGANAARLIKGIPFREMVNR